MLVAVAASPIPARAGDGQSPPAASHGISQKIAVLGLEALGMDREPVARLETLFRMELERLAGAKLPTSREVQRVISRSRRLRRCGGADSCLAQIGKKLGVDLVVTGNVAALGDSYILNIKAVDVATGKKLPKRIATKPLRGSPDELIEAVRVAAYELLAPDDLEGSIMVLSDLVGAKVTLDGHDVGKTPLAKPLAGLTLGDHELSVEKSGYHPFQEKVRVRFQKTTRVIVRLVVENAPLNPTGHPAPVIVKKRPAARHWYDSTWFIVGAGVAAAVVGGVVGYGLGHNTVIDCTRTPEKCAAASP